MTPAPRSVEGFTIAGPNSFHSPCGRFVIWRWGTREWVVCWRGGGFIAEFQSQCQAFAYCRNLAAVNG